MGGRKDESGFQGNANAFKKWAESHLSFEDDVEGVCLCTFTHYNVLVLVLDLQEESLSALCLFFYKTFVQKRRVRTSSIESMSFDSCKSFRSLRVRDLQQKHDLGDADIFYVVESHFQNSRGALGSFSSNVQFAGQQVKN